MRSWTLKSDLSRASGDELDDIQATCNDLLETHEQLRAIAPNDHVKRRLEGEATYIAQEWSEIYNREKARLMKGHFENLCSSLEEDIEVFHREWAEVHELFSCQGYSEGLHERYKALSCPEAFTRTEENFSLLQETKEKLKSAPNEEKFDAAIQELRSKWDDVKEKIHELHPRVKVMAESHSEYEEKLQALLLWVQKTESTCKALESVAEYSTFQPLLESFQTLASEREEHSQSLQRLTELSEILASSSNNPQITYRLQSVTEQFEAVLPMVHDGSDTIPTLQQCFEHQRCVQRHVAFLEEVRSRLKVEVCLDGVVDVENELAGIEDILQSVEAHQDQIQDAIIKGKGLAQIEGSLPCLQSDVVSLESLSKLVSQECTVRRQELTAALDNWTRYNEALEGFKEVLTKGEVELTRRKSSNVTGIETVSDQILEIKEFHQQLQSQLAEYNFIFSVGNTIKGNASEDSRARIEEQLNSISSLKKSLFDEITSHQGRLDLMSKRWEGFQEQMDEFVQYMDKVDSRLERRRESRVSQEWLTQVKGVSNELFQRRQSFSVFTDEARKLSEGVVDAGTMHFKAKLCSLRERWNELFEKARMSESTAEQGLKPLNEYQEVFEEFTSRFEELEEKLEAPVPFFGSSEEVGAHLEKDKLLVDDLRKLRGVLDNLIWKGSELSASMRLKDLDIKGSLKQLEEKWNQAVQNAEKKLVDLDDLRLEWAEKEEMLVNVESLLYQAEEQLETERGLLSREESSLKAALSYYEDVQQEMEQGESDFRSAVENYQEISNSGKYLLYVQDKVVDEKCDSLTKKWESVASSIPQRVEVLREEINSWRGFYETLDAFVAWVDEMEGFTKMEKPRDELEAVQQLRGLEEFQSNFRSRQGSFESLVKEGREVRLKTSKGAEAERLGEKLTRLTDRWDEMLRWAAGRYQLLVLSRHYLDSSKHVVQYLEKIEEKLTTAKEIPPTVLERIREESRKAKAKVDLWKQQCLDLDVVLKEGHLMLQQDSSGTSVAFDEKLGSLNVEWHTVILDVEEKKKTIEKTAKKWWDFTRNKLKMIRWLKKKESDAEMQNSVTCRIDSAHNQLTAYQGILDRLNAHKRDLEALNRAAQDMMDADEDGWAMKEIQELIGRFETLQKNISEKREFFQRVTVKWHQFAEQKHKMNDFFKNTQGIVTKRLVKNAEDCKKLIEECKAVGRDLDENESMLEAVNLEACQLLQELKLVEGLVDTEGVEEQLRLVNQRWNDAKLQVGVKQQALEQVASEFEVLEKDKEEMEQWISGVKKELTSPAIDEGQETEKTIRKQKLKDEVASRGGLLKRLSLRSLKMMEDFADTVDVNMSESFEPFFHDWENVHELVGIPVDVDQKETIEKLKRPPYTPPQLGGKDNQDDEVLPEIPEAASVRRLVFRRVSYGSENSLDAIDRKNSYECSMDTLWSSSSTFSLCIDNKDEDYVEAAGLFIENALGSGEVFVGGSEPNLLDRRDRSVTISGDVSAQSMTGLDSKAPLSTFPDSEQCSKESLETVTGDETPRPVDRTPGEIRSAVDNVIVKIMDTCRRLSFCSYTPEDTVEDVQRKLRECKVLEHDLQSSKGELEDLKEDMIKKKMDVVPVEKAVAEARGKLEESIAQAPDTKVELEYVIELFSEYAITVQEWRAWFCPALATLEGCKGTFKNKKSLEDMNEKLQVLLDEMDKNDQLIGEVYNKGDVLLQVITGKSKASVEGELNQLEQDWAEFCQDTISTKSVIEETLQTWSEYEENRDKLAEWLGELERVHSEPFNGPANANALKDKLEEKKNLRKEMGIQELVLDFVNVKGQELSSKVEENNSLEADLQQINDMWNNVQELVVERTKELKGIVAELSGFEEDLGRLGDILNYTEVCVQESESSKVPGYNGLQNQLAKLKAVAHSFEGHVAQLTDVQERGCRLRERCNTQGRQAIDGKLQTLQRRWSDVKQIISSKAEVVEGKIDEWSSFTKELDQRLTELRNAEISLGTAIISTADLKTLEDQLAAVKALCDDFEQGQPHLEQLTTKSRSLLGKVPDADRKFLETQLNALVDLQANVIRKSLAKQEELIRYIVQQQDFDTQVQSCMHILRDVESSLADWELDVVSNLTEMKDKLSLCEPLFAELQTQKEFVNNLRDKGKKIVQDNPSKKRGTLEKLRTVGDKWNKVQRLASEKKEHLRKNISDLEAFETKYSECMKTLENLSGEASVDSGEAFTKAKATVEEVLRVGREICSVLLDKERVTLAERLENLRVTWEKLLGVREESKRMREREALKVVKVSELEYLNQSFVLEVEDFSSWLCEAEKTLQVNMFFVPEDQQMNVILRQEKLFNEIQQQGLVVSEIMARGKDLSERLTEQERSIVKQQLQGLSERWNNVQKLSEEQGTQLERCIVEQADYYDELEKCVLWMQETSMCLVADELNPNDVDAVAAELENHSKLCEDIKKREHVTKSVIEKGMKLCDKVPAEERAGIEEQLARVEEDWNNLHQQAKDKEDELKRHLSQAVEDDVDSTVLRAQKENIFKETEECLQWIHKSQGECEKEDVKAEVLSQVESRYDFVESLIVKGERFLENTDKPEKNVFEPKLLKLKQGWRSLKMKARTLRRRVGKQGSELGRRQFVFWGAVAEVRNWLEDARRRGVNKISAKSVKQLEEALNVCTGVKSELLNEKSRLENLISNGQVLAADWEGENHASKENIISQLETLKEEWESLNKVIDNQEEWLHAALEHFQRLESDFEKVCSSFMKAENKLNDILDGNRFVSLESEIQCLKDLLSDFELCEAEIASIESQDRGMEADLKSLQDAFTVRVCQLGEKLADAKKRIRDQIERDSETERQRTFFTMELLECKQLVSKVEGVANEEFNVQNLPALEEDVVEAKAAILSAEKSLQLLLAKSDELLDNLKCKEQSSLEAEINDLKSHWEYTKETAEERVGSLESCIETKKVFDQEFKACIEWIETARKEIADSELIASEVLSLEEHVTKLYDIQTECTTSDGLVNKVLRKGEDVLGAVDQGGQQTVQSQLYELRNSAKVLVEQSEAEIGRFERRLAESRDFQTAFEELRSWIKEKTLLVETWNEPADINLLDNNLSALERQLEIIESKKVELEEMAEKERKLAGKPTITGVHPVESQLEGLKMAYEQLEKRVLDRAKVLREKTDDVRKLETGLRHCKEAVNDIEDALGSEPPSFSDTEEMKVYVQELKAKFEDAVGHSSSIFQLHENGRRALSAEAKKEYDDLVDKCKTSLAAFSEKIAKTERKIAEQKELNESFEEVSSWVESAEREMSEMLESTQEVEEIVEQAEKLKALNSKCFSYEKFVGSLRNKMQESRLEDYQGDKLDFLEAKIEEMHKSIVTKLEKVEHCVSDVSDVSAQISSCKEWLLQTKKLIEDEDIFGWANVEKLEEKLIKCQRLNYEASLVLQDIKQVSCKVGQGIGKVSSALEQSLSTELSSLCDTLSGLHHESATKAADLEQRLNAVREFEDDLNQYEKFLVEADEALSKTKRSNRGLRNLAEELGRLKDLQPEMAEKEKDFKEFVEKKESFSTGNAESLFQDRLTIAAETFQNLGRDIDVVVDETEAKIKEYLDCSKKLEDCLEWLTKIASVVDADVKCSLEGDGPEQKLARLKHLRPEIDLFDSTIASIGENITLMDLVGEHDRNDLRNKFTSIKEKWELLSINSRKKENDLTQCLQAKEKFISYRKMCRETLDSVRKSLMMDYKYSAKRENASAQLEKQRLLQEKLREVEENIVHLEEAGDEVVDHCKEMRETLKQEVICIKEDWQRMNVDLTLRQEEYESWVSVIGDIHSEVQLIVEQVMAIHSSLQSYRLEGIDLPSVNDALTVLKRLKSTLESQRESIENTLEKGRLALEKLDDSEKSDLEGSLHTLETVFRNAENDSKEMVLQAEKRINDIIQLDKDSARCQSLLTIYQAAAPSDVSCTVETLEGQVDKLRRLYGDMESRESHMATLQEKPARLTGSPVAVETGHPNSEEIMGDLQGDWGKLKASVGGKLRELERLAQTKQDFENDYEKCLEGVKELEGYLRAGGSAGYLETRIKDMQDLCSRIKSFRNKLDLLADRCDGLPNVAYEQKRMDPKSKLSSLVNKWEEMKEQALGKLNELEKEKAEIQHLTHEVSILQRWMDDVVAPFVGRVVPAVIDRDGLDSALVASKEFRSELDKKSVSIKQLLDKVEAIKSDDQQQQTLLCDLQGLSRNLQHELQTVAERESEIKNRVGQRNKLLADIGRVRDLLEDIKNRQNLELAEFSADSWIEEKLAFQRQELSRVESCDLFLATVVERIVQVAEKRSGQSDTSIEVDLGVLSENIRSLRQLLSEEITQLETLYDFEKICTKTLKFFEIQTARIQSIDLQTISDSVCVASSENELARCRAIHLELCNTIAGFEASLAKSTEAVQFLPLYKREELDVQICEIKSKKGVLKELITKRLHNLRELVAKHQTFEGWLKTSEILMQDSKKLLSEQETSFTVDLSCLDVRSQTLYALRDRLQEYQVYASTFQGSVKASQVTSLAEEMSNLQEQLTFASDDLLAFKEKYLAFETESREARAMFERCAADSQAPVSIEEAQSALTACKELSQEVENKEKLLSMQGKEVSGKLNRDERQRFDAGFRNLNEEWRKAKERLQDKRRVLEDGLSSFTNYCKSMEHAEFQAKEIDQLLSDISVAKEQRIENLAEKWKELKGKLEIFESSMVCVSENAALVPATFRESKEQESTMASLVKLLENAKTSQETLQETLSFHKQYQEAVDQVCNCFREIEEELQREQQPESEQEGRSVFQELQEGLDAVTPLLQTAVEKGHLLILMESYGTQDKEEVQCKLNELRDAWTALEEKIRLRLDEAEVRCDVVAVLDSEIRTVSKRLDELAASTEDLRAETYDVTKVLEQRENYETFSKEVSSLQGSVEDLSSRCQELMNCTPTRQSEKLEEQLDTLKTICDDLEGQVTEKQEEFEETLWRWQEFQSDIDASFRNLAMMEKSLDFQSINDDELEEHQETLQMLVDNLDIQESILGDIKTKAESVLELFPAADSDRAKMKLVNLEQRFLLVKERLQRKQEEMLKCSVDWHEFECGLKSCLEWVQRAELRLAVEVDLPDNELDIGKLKAFGDELDVRLSDFESVRSQGDRLIGQLGDRMESEALKKQMDDVSDRWERIQHLVVEKEQMVGESYYCRAEFEIALKDCYKCMEQYKRSLRETDSAESLEERHRIKEELEEQLDVIRILARDINERGISVGEREEINAKLLNVQKELAELDMDKNFMSQVLSSPPKAMSTSEQNGLSAAGSYAADVPRRNPTTPEFVENGDIDLADSESGVSSMDSFEGFHRKESGHPLDENGMKQDGNLQNDASNVEERSSVGISFSPEKYQRTGSNSGVEDVRAGVSPSLNHACFENGELSRGVDEPRINNISDDVNVPLVTVTDENGTPTEVEFAETTSMNGNEAVHDDRSFSQDEEDSNQAGEFFLDDFDVYYGEENSKSSVASAIMSNTMTKSQSDAQCSDRSDEGGTDSIAVKRRKRPLDDSSLDESNGQLQDHEPVTYESFENGVSSPKHVVTKDAELKDESLSSDTETPLKSSGKFSEGEAKAVKKPETESDFAAGLESTGNFPRQSTPSELAGVSYGDDSVHQIEVTRNTSSVPGDVNDHSDFTEVLSNPTIAADSVSTTKFVGDEPETPSSFDLQSKGFKWSKELEDSQAVPENDRRTAVEINDFKTSTSYPHFSSGTGSGDLRQMPGKTCLRRIRPNVVMDRMPNMLNIDELIAEQTRMQVEAARPHDRIAAILSERRKADEAERSRFVGTSQRDTDSELYTSRPLELAARSSRLREFIDPETALHEDMTLNEFLVEIDKIFEKLQAIEELVRGDIETEENVKDKLAKHVSLCVMLSKQQDRIDQMNLLSKTFLHGNASLEIILEERLQEVNSVWRQVQLRASSKQEELEMCVQEQMQDLEGTRQREVMAFAENFAFLRSLFLTADCCDGPTEDEIRKSEIEELYDDDLRSQIALHELFVGLSSVEELVVSERLVEGDLTTYCAQLTRMQRFILSLAKLKDKLDSHSRRFSSSAGDDSNLQQQIIDLNSLSVGVIKLLLSKQQELRAGLEKMVKLETALLNRRDFEEKLQEWTQMVNEIEEFVKHLGPFNEDEANLELLHFEFLRTHSVIQECLHDFLNEESSKGTSPRKKLRLSELNKRWGRIRTILQNRERKLIALGVLASELKTAVTRPVLESVVPEKEVPVLALTPEKVPEADESRATTPRSKSPSPAREQKTPLSVERKSPRTKKRQYEEELKEFSDWLAGQEKAFHELADDDSLPPNMEALRERLKQFQVFCRSLQSHKSRVEMMRQYAIQSGERLDAEVADQKYEDVTKICDSMYEVCEESADWLQSILILWQSFEGSSRKFNSWLDNVVQRSLAPIREMEENQMDTVLIKLMKYRKLDRKLTERQPSKDGLVYEAEQVLTATENQEVRASLDQFRERWRVLRHETRGERQRLERLLQFWREYDVGMDELLDWIMSILSFMRGDDTVETSLDAVEEQLQNLRRYQSEVESHQAEKENLDQIYSRMLETVRGSAEDLIESQSRLDDNWSELCALITDREEELLSAQTDLMLVRCRDDVELLTVWLQGSRDTLSRPIVVLSTATLEDAKSQLGEYRKIRKELCGKQEILDTLNREANKVMNKHRNTSVRNLVEGIQCLNSQKAQLLSLLSEKEEKIKDTLNRWVDFQKVYSELKNINEWFEEREETLARYQRIVTQREFEIALEDVKAMKGFLATQQEAVENVLVAARRLRGDSAFDQQELQETIDTVEERWSELTSKVGEYEAWLQSSVQACQQYDSSVLLIKEFISEVEERLRTSVTQDLQGTKSQMEWLQALKGEMNDISSRLDEVTELATDWAENSDSSASQRLTTDVTSLTERFATLSAGVIEREKIFEDVMVKWQRFDSSCSDMLSWVEIENTVLSESVTVDVSLTLQLEQLAICKQMQEDVDLHRDWLASINTMADSLTGNTYFDATQVSPMRSEVCRKFASLQELLKSKHERLISSTLSYTQLQDSVDRLITWLEEAEERADSGGGLEHRERLECLQDLVREVDDSQNRFEALSSNVDDKVTIMTQKEVQEMREQVTQLEGRWAVLRRKLLNSVEDIRRTVKRQEVFEQEYLKMCSMLQTLLRGTETSLDQTDMAVDLDRIEDFQMNYDRYHLDFQNVLRQAELLDQDTNAGINFKTSLDDSVTRVRHLWTSVLKRADEYKDEVGRQLGRLKEFQESIRLLNKWMDGLQMNSGFSVPSSSSIQQMKVHFEHVKMCQKEVDAHRPDYTSLCCNGQKIIEDSNGTLSNQASKELDKVTRRWVMITNRVLSNQQQLELSLKEWQEYTSLTENLMVWLREKEKLLKSQPQSASIRGLQRELDAKKAISHEIDDRRIQLEKVTRGADELSRSTDQYDSERIKKQVSSMVALWENLCRLLTSSVQSLSEIVRQFEQFSLLHEKLSQWLTTIESSVSRELEESFLSIPDDQGDTVFQVYVADIEGHEGTRSTMNECAYFVISRGSGTPYAGTVAGQQKSLNDRWRSLCQQLGITYKKAEETRYGLKLLEIQLKQLNTWMKEVEGRVEDFSVTDSCEIPEIQRKVAEMKDTEADVGRHAIDVQTVLRLCEKLRRDRMACSVESDRQALQRTTESFESRWTNVRQAVSMKRRQVEERLSLCREFWNEYRNFVEWLNEAEQALKMSDEAGVGVEISRSRLKRFEMFVKDITDHHPQLERITKRSKYLIQGMNTSTAADDIRLGVESADARWQAIFSEVENLVNRQSKLTSRTKTFEELSQEVDSFLTEAELKLIALDPYTCGDEPRVQLEKLKGLQRLINTNYSKLKSLLQEGKSIREYCSSTIFQSIQQTMDELNSRWQQALHCCMTWILDLAIPSHRTNTAIPSAESSKTRKLS